MTRNPRRLLLISPGMVKWTDVDFGLPHLVSLGGYVEAHTGVRAEILDLGYEGGDHRTLARTVASLGPLLCIGISCYSSYDLVRVLALARYLRAAFPGVPLVTGGYHASAVPSDLDFDGSPFDAVVVGEGERPLRDIVLSLLSGAPLDRRWGPDPVDDLDELPPTRWDLLDRYWPRAHLLGRKLQVYLSRGCPYHCTFCMERAKSGYTWRAFSPGRAIDELVRLSERTDLSRWVVNVADPLFGFQRAWRREVLQGIIDKSLIPRQFWTLTRSEDLDEEDVSLLARARFSIGVGLESGSPTMLATMQKTRDPARYLDAITRLARLSRRHGLSWAANVIVGHPGETPETMRESRDFLAHLYTEGEETCGWLSVDPFRLYPGSQVHETLPAWQAQHGARFHHPGWWRSLYDGPFRAEHIDPSAQLTFEDRVRFQMDAYGPLVRTIADRFRGQGRSIDRVFARSLSEQVRLLSPEQRDATLSRARVVTRANGDAHPIVLSAPIGLNLRDERVRLREEAVRRLLDRGRLRSSALVEALLTVAPEHHLDDDAVRRLLRGEPHSPVSGAVPAHVGLFALVAALEALEPAAGDRVLDVTGASGYVPALLAALVGPEGEVVALSGRADPTTGAPATGLFDRVYVGGALPRLSAELAALVHPEEGRIVAFVGPRFAAQDLVCKVRRGEAWDERVVGRVRVPVLTGRRGWLGAS